MDNNSPPLQEIIFHIGPHKTASTYIQKMFVENRKCLADQGICYPEEGIGPEYGHHQIVKDITNKKISSDLEQVLKLRHFQKIIFSSENFDRFRQPEVKALKNALPKDVKVSFIYFIRRPHELLTSSWQETIKHGSTKSWAEYFLEHTLHPYRSPLLNHVLVLKHYGNVFGYENIHLVDYNYLKESNIDVFSFLINYLGFPAPEAENNLGKSINKSLPYVNADIMRAFNALCEWRLGDSTVLIKNPTIRSSVAFKSEMKELEKIVSLKTVDVVLNKLNFENGMRKYFQQELAGCNWTTPIAEVGEEVRYQFPASSWVLCKNVINHLEKMFSLIPETSSSRAVSPKF